MARTLGARSGVHAGRQAPHSAALGGLRYGQPTARFALTAKRVWFVHSLSFLIPALLATDYTVNRFYTLGAAMWDSGWFAHLAVSGLRNPPAIGGSFLSDHMSLVFVVKALLHELMPDTAAPV